MSDHARSAVQSSRTLTVHQAVGLRCCMLGKFGIFWGEKSLTAGHIRLRKARDLLKLLALTPGHRMHREQLQEKLWPEREPDSGAHSLSQTLYTLRPILAELDPSIQVKFEDESLVLLASDGISTDVEDFEHLARAALSQADPLSSRAAACCKDAIVSYSGDLLPEDGPSDLYDQRRDELRRLYIELLLRLADYNLEAQEFIPAIDTLQKVIGSDPANEEAHTRLMRAYALNGQRQAALRQFEIMEEALRRDLDVDTAPESQLLREQIASGALTSHQPSFDWLFTPQHNLPSLVSSFIGREDELAEVSRMVQAHRLVTLTGAGGVGKTRLALKAAESQLEKYSQGVFWVELAALTSPERVAKVVLETLRLPGHDSRPEMERLVDFLRRRRVLLLLDNCEHLAASCARLAEDLLKACQDLHILATSRVRLNLPGEMVYRVPSLAAPDLADSLAPDALERYDAVRLFMERARSFIPGFEITPGNVPAVARICRRLDGIPLALELAAARSRMLSTEQISSQLEDAFHLLVGGSQASLPRHRTLRASIEWSYALLSEKERLLLQRLSVFVGGWGLEAAEAVCAGEGIRQAEVLDLLGALVDHSLVIAEILPGGEARYNLLETVRQYMLERLAESGGETIQYQRHLEYYLRLAEQADEGIRGPQQLVWLKRLEQERSNLNSAMECALNSSTWMEMGIRLACALTWYWGLVGDFIQARYFLSKALSLSANLGRTPTRAEILYQAAFTSFCCIPTLDEEQTLASFEESLEIYRELGTGYLFERTRSLLWVSLIKAYDYGDEQSLAALRDCRRIFHDLGSPWWEAWTLNLMALERENNNASEAIYEIIPEETKLWKQAGDRWGEALPLQDLGLYAFEHGEFAEARQWFLQSLTIYEAFGSKGMAFQVLRDMGHASRALGEYDQAEIYYQSAEKMISDLGWEHRLPVLNRARGFIALHQGEDSRAAKCFKDALRTAQENNLTHMMVFCIAGIASLCVARQNLPSAARLFGAASALMDANRFKADPADRLEIDYFLGLCQEQCETDVFEQAWEAGRALKLEQAAASALGFVS